MKDNQREGQIFYIGSVNLAALRKKCSSWNPKLENN